MNKTEVNKLKAVNASLQKSVNSSIENVSKFDKTISDFSLELALESKTEESAIKKQLEKILLPLVDVGRLIKENALTDIVDFKSFKKEMVQIQDNIQNLKYDSKQNLELLKEEEDILTNDLKLLDECVDYWSKPINIKLNPKLELAPKSKLIPSIENEKETHKEVKAFMDFVFGSGGHENGWEKADHLLFLKLRNKFHSIEKVARNLHLQLPDISEEAVREHENWYQQYLALKHKKDEAISEWKTKRKEKPQQIQSTYKLVKGVDPKSKIKIKEKLTEWKAQKLEKYEHALKIEETKMQQEKEKQEMLKQRNEEMKNIVSSWKQNKIQLKECAKVNQIMEKSIEKKKRAAQANKLIKEYQTQDDFFVSRMKEIRKPKETASIRSKSCDVISKRDPGRLFKPTKQWLNRINEDEDLIKFGSVNYIQQVPKLAIPDWRKKML